MKSLHIVLDRWRAGEPALAPLDPTVKDLAAKPAERRQAALQLAQYFLPKKPTIKKSRHGNFLPDECGFVVDPDLARELRDLKLELACLPFSSKKRSPHIVARKASELQKRIEEIRQSLECPCPSRYQLKRHVSAGPDGEIIQDGEIALDKARIEILRRRRVEKKIFTPEEDLEEAVRTARYESFLLGQEMTGRHRLAELREKQRAARIGYGPLLTAGQAAVLRVLTLLYPPPPKPPPSEIMLADHPFLDLRIAEGDHVSARSSPKQRASLSPKNHMWMKTLKSLRRFRLTALVTAKSPKEKGGQS